MSEVKNIKLNNVVLDIVSNVYDSGWIHDSVDNNLMYRKYGELVTVRYEITSTHATSTKVGTLPKAFRPVNRIMSCPYSDPAGAGASEFTIQQNGDVYIQNAMSAGVSACLTYIAN